MAPLRSGQFADSRCRRQQYLDGEFILPSNCMQHREHGAQFWLGQLNAGAIHRARPDDCLCLDVGTGVRCDNMAGYRMREHFAHRNQHQSGDVQ